ARAAASGDPAGGYEAPRVWCTLGDRRLDEVSGLAPSRRDPGVLWAHNDSGDRPRVFAVDTLGHVLAVCTLRRASNVDWEDMASVDLGGQAWVYVGDIGDNRARRAAITVYRFREPPVGSGWRDSSLAVTPERATFRYPDGSRDCETLMVDRRDGTLLFVEKGGAAPSLYASAWPGDGGQAVLRRLGVVLLPPELLLFGAITGGDMHPDGTRIALRTYGSLYEFRRAGATPASLLASPPAATLSTPQLLQPESICYTADGTALCTATEGRRPQVVILRRRP
ncbi:MAG: hypothetical protein AB1505_17560, partial [Candidatus Latescibacterota bacterium]